MFVMWKITINKNFNINNKHGTFIVELNNHEKFNVDNLEPFPC